MSESSSIQQEALFVGDNLALDFINTVYGMGPRFHDCFVDDASVLAWLKLAGLAQEAGARPPKGLLALARELRDNASALVIGAKEESGANAAVVNRVLELGRPRKELAWDDDSKSFKVISLHRNGDAASLLEPIADAVVKLLTDEQLALVRQCEAHDCTLFFHDLTKSHRRRWCSMAACGNRMKVAAFRSRQKGE